ncbi:MAG: N-acetylglucosamine kinase, partial [Micromonosporaceae bacterium]
MTAALVLGLDIGGTTSRALLADSHGRRLGTGTAAGGNPTSHHETAAFAAISAAIRDALAGVDPAQVRAAAIGMAGVSRLAEPDVREQFEAAWHGTGLRCAYQAVSDAVVAFTAGTPSPDGTLLLAGTGAIAAQLRDRTGVRTCDGHGWLLGDLGSGFWLGREAVRAALAYLDGWAPATPLVHQVIGELVGTQPPGRDSVINAVRRDEPVALARLAQPVCQAADAGDPVATEIVARAAEHLIESAARVRAGDDGPLVLGGGLLIAETALAARVCEAAAQR